MERAYTNAEEILTVTLTIAETWGSYLAHGVVRQVFISWKFLLPWFFEINFDGSSREMHVGASFVIRGPGLRLVAAGGSYLFELTIPAAKLHGAWARIAYTRRILHADHLIIEDNSAIVVTWI